ncbi:MAG: PilZ domain-containing protein [Legionella sp.]
MSATEPSQESCVFTNVNTLYLAYMPFVKNGGLFIRTKHSYSLGQQLNLSIKLFNEVEEYIVEGAVVWITPKGAQNNKQPGVGVQFLSENSRFVSNKIDTYLASMLKSAQLTDTI